LLSIDSLNYRELSRAAVKAAAPAALLTAAAALLLWGRGPAGRDAAWGLGAAWALASLGAAALLAARQVSPRAFWLAFWGGMGSRLALLAALMAVCLRSPGVCAPALLAGYAAGLIFLLPLEFRLVPAR